LDCSRPTRRDRQECKGSGAGLAPPSLLFLSHNAKSLARAKRALHAALFRQSCDHRRHGRGTFTYRRVRRMPAACCTHTKHHPATYMLVSTAMGVMPVVMRHWPVSGHHDASRRRWTDPVRHGRILGMAQSCLAHISTTTRGSTRDQPPVPPRPPVGAGRGCLGPGVCARGTAVPEPSGASDVSLCGPPPIRDGFADTAVLPARPTSGRRWRRRLRMDGRLARSADSAAGMARAGTPPTQRRLV
jgi:hypothetical protein